MDDMEKLMALLNKLSESMPEVVTKVSGPGCDCDDDERPEGYIQVGTLTPENAASRLRKNREAAKDRAEAVACRDRAMALKAKNEAAHSKWWSDLYRSQSLPADGKYWIADDNKIWMKPTGKQKEKSDE